MKRPIRNVFIFFLFILFSCSNEDLIISNSLEQKDENFVNTNQANDIAALIGNSSGSDLRGTQEIREIKEIIPFGDSQRPAYYIVNYKDEKGYIILAGDTRTDPILAYGTSGNFDLNADEFPYALKQWMTNAYNRIEGIREFGDMSLRSVSENRFEINEKLISMVQRAFIGIEDEHLPDEPEPCNDRFEQKGPLLKTKWGQRYGYNELVPKNCSGEKAPAGCVAIAMAQIMKYYRYPSSYNWDQMPDDDPTTETARLIRDIGDKVYMDYGCSGSGASMRHAWTAFFTYFGYNTSIHLEDYNHEKLVHEIALGYPVMLSGGEDSFWGLIGLYPNGHAWVCDGYKEYWICGSNGSINYGSLYLHMNWGWYGKHHNEWYGFQDWDPAHDGNHYNNRRKMIYNIRKF